MQGMVNWWRRAWLILAVAGVIIVLDQWTKDWVRRTVPEYTSMVPIPALGEYFVFEHVRNYGAAFGILQNQGNLFVVIAIVVAVAILVYARNLDPRQRWLRVLLGMQLGGAVGNLIDRLNQGYVTDFVKMGIPDVYYWPNYNIADSSIVVGVIALGVYLVWEDVRQQRLTAHEKTRADELPAEHP
ncbi:MAG: signal peptidase II [Chloroflexi bacterium]|nr:MAG: signal peptidase II [Chloroflexota bacterium]